MTDAPDVAKLAAEMSKAWKAVAYRDENELVFLHVKHALALLDAFDARGRELDQANARADKAEHDLARLTVNAGQRIDEKGAEVARLKGELETARRVVGEAYGFLWQVETVDVRIHQARRLSLSLISKEEQRAGISNTRPLECGHPISLGIISAETGEFLYCDLCNTRSERNDAVSEEERWRARATAAETARDAAREALFMCAAHHQGGHSDTGAAIAKAFGIPFPVRMADLERAAIADGLDPQTFWPWLSEMRTARALADDKEARTDG